MKMFRTVCILLLFALLQLPANLKAEDFNSTYTHFLLSNAQNVKLELEKRRTFSRAIKFELQLENFQKDLEQMLFLDSLAGITNGLPSPTADGSQSDYTSAKENVLKVDTLFTKNFHHKKSKSKKLSAAEKKQKLEWVHQARDLCYESIRLFSKSSALIDNYKIVAINFIYLAATQKILGDENPDFALKSALNLNPEIKLPKMLKGLLRWDLKKHRKNIAKGNSTFEITVLPENIKAEISINGKAVKKPFKKRKTSEGFYFIGVKAAGQKDFNIGIPVFGGGKNVRVVLASLQAETESRATVTQLEMREDEQEEGFTNFFAKVDIFTPKEINNSKIKTLYSLLMIGLQLKTWNINGFTISGHGGFSGFIIQEKPATYGSYETQLAFWNFMLGVEMGYEYYIQIGADVSMNALTFHGNNKNQDTIFDFDQVNFYLQSPFLGGFAALKYDIGSNTPRDIHTGYSHSFRKYNLGVLTLAYSGRFDYDITGRYVKNDGLYVDKINGDHSGMLLWERVRPAKSMFELGAGICLGSVEDVARFAFLQAGVMIFNKYLVFARGSNTWSRLGEERLWGAAIGAELPVHRDMIFIRAKVGFRDYETVDRYGDPAKVVVSAMVNISP